MPLKYENDFIVSGRPGDAITPNFKVKEFSEGGAIFAHRELIGALQELRDGYGASISIQGLAPRGTRGKNARGCFAFVRADDMGALETQARALVAQTFLATAERAGSDLYVEIPDPQNLPPLAGGRRVRAGHPCDGRLRDQRRSVSECLRAISMAPACRSAPCR